MDAYTRENLINLIAVLRTLDLQEIFDDAYPRGKLQGHVMGVGLMTLCSRRTVIDALQYKLDHFDARDNSN